LVASQNITRWRNSNVKINLVSYAPKIIYLFVPFSVVLLIAIFTLDYHDISFFRLIACVCFGLFVPMQKIKSYLIWAILIEVCLSLIEYLMQYYLFNNDDASIKGVYIFFFAIIHHQMKNKFIIKYRN